MGVICTNLANELGHHLVLPATVAGAAASVTSLLLKVSYDPAEIFVSRFRRFGARGQRMSTVG